MCEMRASQVVWTWNWRFSCYRLRVTGLGTLLTFRPDALVFFRAKVEVSTRGYPLYITAHKPSLEAAIWPQFAAGSCGLAASWLPPHCASMQLSNTNSCWGTLGRGHPHPEDPCWGTPQQGWGEGNSQVLDGCIEVQWGGSQPAAEMQLPVANHGFWWHPTMACVWL